MPFGDSYPKTNYLVRGLDRVINWLRDLSTSTTELSTVVPNLELELRRASPDFSGQMRQLLEVLNGELPPEKPTNAAGLTRWYDPSLLFEEISEKEEVCLLGPDVRACVPLNLNTKCCYEEPKQDYPTEELLCRVVALQDLKRFNLELTRAHALLSDEVLMQRLGQIPRKSELRGSRPFNWVAGRSELEGEVAKARKAKEAGDNARWTERDRATRVRDVLGLVKQVGQDYLILITFPEDARLEKQARSTVWEGVCAPFRPFFAPMRHNGHARHNMTLDLSEAPNIAPGVRESCCCSIPFTDEFRVEPMMEKPDPLNTQDLRIMFQNWLS